MGTFRGATCPQHQSFPKELFYEILQEFKKADFILLVCTEIYRRRFEDEEEKGKGLGVTWEAFKVIRELYVSKGENRRFIPILLDPDDSRHIPERLSDHSRYVIPDDWEPLYRRLTNQSAVEAQPLGPLRDMPPRSSGPKDGELRQRYLRQVASRCGYLSMAGIDPKARRSGHLQLDQIFTSLDVRKSTFWELESGGDEPVRTRPHDPAEMEKQTREPVLAAISRHSRLVLLGKPGSGKSTLVNFICLCLANELLDRGVRLAQLAEQGWTLPALLPVPVTLREYAAQGLPEGEPLWAFIREQRIGTRLF